MPCPLRSPRTSENQGDHIGEVANWHSTTSPLRTCRILASPSSLTSPSSSLRMKLRQSSARPHPAIPPSLRLLWRMLGLVTHLLFFWEGCGVTSHLRSDRWFPRQGGDSVRTSCRRGGWNESGCTQRRHQGSYMHRQPGCQCSIRRSGRV